MIALIQRVSHAEVSVQGETVARIGSGLLVLLGAETGDTRQSADRLLQKTLSYRIFADGERKMNLNVRQAAGSLLVVSQFTLAADTKKGLRPDFSRAAKPDDARALYDYFCAEAAKEIHTQTSIFGAEMLVSLANDGPATFWLQT